MNGEQVRELILFNNKKIEELLDPSTFVLKPEVEQLLKKNEQLRKECPHVYQNGECIYCGTTE